MVSCFFFTERSRRQTHNDTKHEQKCIFLDQKQSNNPFWIIKGSIFSIVPTLIREQQRDIHAGSMFCNNIYHING